MASRARTLEQVNSEYPIILIDTSALLSTFKYNGNDNFSEKKSRSELFESSAVFYREFLEGGGIFYITPSVIREFINSSCAYYKRMIKKEGVISKERIEYHRQVKKEHLEKGRLVRLLEDRELILELDEDEKEKYMRLNNKHYHEGMKRGLSEVDFDLINSGATVSMTRIPTALISNDIAIFHLWRKYLKKDTLDKDKLGFFTRKGFDVFKKEKS